LASFGKEDGAGGSRTTTYLQAAHPALRERYRSAPPSDGGNSASSSPSPSGTSVDEISTAWTTNKSNMFSGHIQGNFGVQQLAAAFNGRLIPRKVACCRSRSWTHCWYEYLRVCC